MSMEEWPDDHLDELFRKSAEEYDVPINNDDWADMSRRLDKLDRQTLFDRVSRWGGIGALVLLLLAGLNWVTYDTNSTGSRQPAVITVIKPGREVATPPAEREETVEGSAQSNEEQRIDPARLNPPEKQLTGVATEAERQRQVTQSINDQAGQKTTRTLDKLLADEVGPKASRSVDALPITVPNTRPASLKKRAVPGSREKLTAVQVARQPVKKRTLPTVENPTLGHGLVTNNPVNSPIGSVLEPTAGTYPIPGGNMAANKTGNQPAMAAELGERTQPAATELSADGPWLPALMPAVSLSAVVQQVISPVPVPSLAEVAINAPVQRSAPRLSRLSILLFASPDLSTVGLKNFERPGNNSGLAIQYQLTDRLSINTAFMYSTKRYQTASSEYVLPSYPHLYVYPEEIIGVCNMIDIPLNLRYDWLLRPRGNGRAPARWFVSAGLTSYFIQHEVYTYQYANPDDPKIRVRDWDNRVAGVPGGSFGFSNLNMSVGYERPISQRLSWQVEPFMKVPLKPVGNFQVKLLSTGAFVGLRYRL